MEQRALIDRLYAYVEVGVCEPLDKVILAAISEVTKEESDVLIYKLSSKVGESLLFLSLSPPYTVHRLRDFQASTHARVLSLSPIAVSFQSSSTPDYR